MLELNFPEEEKEEPRVGSLRMNFDNDVEHLVEIYWDAEWITLQEYDRRTEK